MSPTLGCWLFLGVMCLPLAFAGLVLLPYFTFMDWLDKRRENSNGRQ